MKTQTLSPLWWLYVPLAIIGAQIVLELLVDDKVLMAHLHSEGGPHETLQSYCLAIALVIAVAGAIKADWKTQKLVAGWFTLAAICTFYVSGEEISWGQHILNWDTPEYWSGINDQNETNFHNTSAWLDQKPRLILFIGICVGGLVIPAMRRWKPQSLPRQFEVLYPSNLLVVPALGVLVPYLVQEIAEHAFGSGVFSRVSELQELYMYYFVALYLHLLYKQEISK